MSKLTKEQTKTSRKDYTDEDGRPAVIIAKVRHDDSCGNGHNSFGVTAESYGPDRYPGEPKIQHKDGKTLWLWGGGQQHEEIGKHFPELKPVLRFHLCSTDGPLHYIANSLYWAGKNKKWCKGAPNDPPNLEHFRSSAIWSDAPVSIFVKTSEELTQILIDRLEGIMTEFQEAVESLGLVY